MERGGDELDLLALPFLLRLAFLEVIYEHRPSLDNVILI